MRVKIQRKHGIRKYACANSSRGMYNVATHQLHFSITNEVIAKVYEYKSIIEIYNETRNKEIKKLS